MSSLAATLTKKVGPMPLGAWLLVGSGGLFIAYRSRQAEAGAPVPAEGDPLPTGGGYPSNGATGSFDGAPVVLSPIFYVPPAAVNVNLPAPVPAPTQPTRSIPAPTPRVPTRTAPAPATTTKARVTISYTIRKGDTLWSIALRQLGSGLKWTTVYAQNKTVIEAAAKRYGYSSSRNGNLIFPGTTLRITK